MRDAQLHSLLAYLRHMVVPSEQDNPTDAQLLERFVTQRDQAAFEVLLWRHGAMVLNVCRRILRHEQDAEDAFQATFLILARKAHCIHRRQAVATWLYKVVYRVALEARAQSKQREQFVHGVADLPAANAPEHVWSDLRPVLDEEVGRLPIHYRTPFVLCYLEGLTNEEAARRLGCPKGTVLSRLARARQRLRKCLARRGVVISVELLAVLLADNAVSAGLTSSQVAATLRAATICATSPVTAGIVSPGVTALTKGTLQAMFWNKLRLAALSVVLLGLLGSGALALSGWTFFSASDRQAGGIDRPPEGGGAGPGEPLARGQERPNDALEDAKNRLRSQQNLKQIALAMHIYHDTFGCFPPPAIYARSDQADPLPGVGGGTSTGDGSTASGIGGGTGASTGGSTPAAGIGGAKGGGAGATEGGGAPAIAVNGGKALLSWRVLVLPYLDEKKLYEEFKLNEPWDSAHNKKLLSRMPKVYAAPNAAGKDLTSTYYQGFVGPHAVFEKHRAMRLADIQDGTSNTLMIVEAGAPVPWTKPEDLAYDPDQPLPQLGGLFRDVIHTAFCDGAVHTLKRDCPEDILRLAITRDDGQPFNFAKLSGSPTAAGKMLNLSQLKEANLGLRQAIDKAARQLDTLKRELVSAQQVDERGREAIDLVRKNMELQDSLHRILQETEAIQQEIKRIKDKKDATRPERKKSKESE